MTKQTMTKEDFDKIIKTSNKDNYFAVVNGINVTHLSRGHAIVEMDVDKDKLNPLGTVHGGCLFTMADTCAGAAAKSYGRAVTTINADINYIRPGKNAKHLIAESNEIKVGKTIIVNEVMIRNEKGAELARGMFTFFTLEDKNK